MLTLKHMNRQWIKTYDLRKIPNNGYYTVGVLVPLEEFEKYVYSTDYIDLEDKDNGHNDSE